MNLTSKKNTLISNKILLCFVVYFLINPIISIAQKQITFIDNKENTPIEGVVVCSETGCYLGISEYNGSCKITNDIKYIQASGLCINDTIVEYNNQDTIKLILKYYRIKEIVIKEKAINDKKLLLNFINNSLGMLKNDTLLYYDLSYNLNVPDSGWFEKATGKIKLIPANKTKNRVFNYCDLNYKSENKNKRSKSYRYCVEYILDINNSVNNIYKSLKQAAKRIKKYGTVELLKRDTTGYIFHVLIETEKASVEKKYYFNNERKLTKFEIYNPQHYGVITRNCNIGLYTLYKFNVLGGLYVENIKRESIVSINGIKFIRSMSMNNLTNPCVECVDFPIGYHDLYDDWVNINSNIE